MTGNVSRREALRKLTAGGLGTAAAPLSFEALGGLARAHTQTHAHPQAAPAKAAADWTPRILDASQDELVTTLSEPPKTSVLNRWQQAHDVKNLFVMDGSAYPSSACQNPTITIMALAARASDYLVEQYRTGAL